MLQGNYVPKSNRNVTDGEWKAFLSLDIINPFRIYIEVIMTFCDKLQTLRKNKGLTQEELAEKINVSRAAVAKWEAGQSYPDISNLIQISDLMNVTVDYLVREQSCELSVKSEKISDLDELIEFRLELIEIPMQLFQMKLIPHVLIPMISDMKKETILITILMSAGNSLQEKKLPGKMVLLCMP